MARIAIVTNSLSGGGAERAMNILANELHRLNHEVTVFAINNTEPDAITLTCSVVEVRRPWRGSVLDTIKSWMIFQKKIREIRPNIVILNCDLPELYGAITPMRAKLIAVEPTIPVTYAGEPVAVTTEFPLTSVTEFSNGK